MLQSCTVLQHNIKTIKQTSFQLSLHPTKTLSFFAWEKGAFKNGILVIILIHTFGNARTGFPFVNPKYLKP